MLIVHVCSLWCSHSVKVNDACFVEPDGRIVFVQFYFDLVLEYLFCCFACFAMQILRFGRPCKSQDSLI
jgi:hypothetical protein